ncbi:O-antigen ligase family protein [Candidatus Azambacteria bacterium]|nr:O-antigen ligase family protein [Candidatus Azambacteria bacterium]
MKLTPLKIIFAAEVVAVVLTATNVLPREMILLWTGLAVFYLLFSPLEDGLILIIASIPFFAALPLSENFDTLANWRILLGVLFLKFLWVRRHHLIPEKLRLGRIEILWFLFFAFSLVTIVVAKHPVATIKYVLFFGNAFLLWLLVKNLVLDQGMVSRIFRALGIAAVGSLAVGFLQYTAIFFTPLANFWAFWANWVSRAFYGNDLATLVRHSNTWFSFYPDAPPTLRMFSVFPDSHSFALFTILGLILFTFLFLGRITARQAGSAEQPLASRAESNIPTWLTWAAIAISFLAIWLAGSRGVWLSSLAPIGLGIFLAAKKSFRPFLKFLAAPLLLFLLLFPFSSFILNFSQGREAARRNLAFERALTISDLEEISNKSRLQIWSTSITSIAAHPLFGVGAGNFPVVLEQEIFEAKRGSSAHNFYLNVAAETGLIGLGLVVLIFLLLLLESWRLFRDQTRPLELRILALSFGLYFSWILAYNLFDVVLANDKVLLLFFTLSALFLTLARYGPTARYGESLSLEREEIPRSVPRFAPQPNVSRLGDPGGG